MTDKEQIMINGVDVRECEYLTYQLEEDGQYYWFCKNSPTGGPDECEYNPDCYFKQLQKEKFENLNNRQMVENAENLIYENSELYKNLKEKEQECEELKEKQKIIGKAIYKESIELCNENACYRKALEEIEEAIETYSRKHQYSIANDLYNQILDIINKAKGDNNENT